MPSSVEKFWRQKLVGLTAPTPLGGALRPRQAKHADQQYGEEQAIFSPTTIAALSVWARTHELTLNTVMQGVWALLLSRYSGEEDVLFGVATSNQLTTIPGINVIVSARSNPIPLRVQVSPEALLVPWLKMLQNHFLDAQPYEQISLAQLQSWSEVPKGLPLFESLLFFEPSPLEMAVQAQEMQEDKWSEPYELVHYPLTLIFLTGSVSSLRVRYDYAYFDAAMIHRLLGHWQVVLKSFLAETENKLVAIPTLTSAEWQRQIIEWNKTQGDYNFECCLHWLVEQQAVKTPERPAVFFEGTWWTYQELNLRANRLAHRLQKLGVGPDVVVGVYAKRSLEMLLGLLAVLKAGGAYLPLDPEYPQDRLNYIIRDARVSLVLTQQPQSASWLQDCKCFPLHLETLEHTAIQNEKVDLAEEENLVYTAQPGNLAYVIYTSGSTGQPKGVLIEHRAICNNLLWMQRDWPLTKDDRVLQKAPFTFDVSVKEFFWPLLAGASLVIARPEGHRDPAYLQALITQMNITVTHFVPSMLQVFLDRAEVDANQSLRLVMCGAETLPMSLQERFFRILSADLLHLYGPTEAAIAITGWLCERDVQRERVPLGRPMPNVQIYLLDSHLQPVPVGVPGQLYIGGVALARGYLNRPVETADKFVPDPFSQKPRARLYKTGDVARYLPDGNLEFLGRQDEQVKVRGLRIELGEIEAVLRWHPGVRECVVLARQDRLGDKRLVAYVVPNQEFDSQERVETFSEEFNGFRPWRSYANNPIQRYFARDLIPQLRSHLQGKLPEYMVPSSFVLLEALPLSPNGKVDRQVLPEPTRLDLQKVYVSPRTQIEQQLAAIWAQVLGFEQIGVHDNFFELGGDSILGIQIVAKANQAGLQITTKHIFEHQTIAEMTAIVGTTSATQAEQGIITGLVPLTPIQRWFFERNVSEPHHYNDAMLLEVRQELKPILLERAVQELLKQHDALRLRFVQGTADWQQEIIDSESASVFSLVDLSALSGADQESTMEQAVARLHSSLNLSEGPLLRVSLFRMGPHKSDRLLMLAHHLVIDGISWRVLLEDLQTAYFQLDNSETVQLPPKTTSFKHWAERLAVYAQSTTLEEELDNWLSVSDIHSFHLPVDYPDGANTVATADVVSVSLSVEETKDLLQTVPEVYHTHINDVLLTALVQSFRQWIGESPLLVDLEGHGREPIFEDVDVSRTLGWFTSIFPVRLGLANPKTPGEALKSIKEQLRCIPNRGFGYGVLRYLNTNEKIIEHLHDLPQPEVSFNYLGQFDQVLLNSSPFSWAREPIGPLYNSSGKRSHLLKINGIITDGRLRLAWEFSKDVHQRTTIEQLAQNFIKTLQSLIAYCQSSEAGGYTPSDFPLAKLDQQEIDHLLQAGRDIEDIYPLSPMQQGLLFHTLYNSQSGAYFVQLLCTIHESLNVSAFWRAWQQVLDRHAILRAALLWDGFDNPLHVLRKQVKLPVEQYDWREQSPAKQQIALEAFLLADRMRGFDLSNAPLMRVTLFRRAQNTYEFVWSLHHVLLDGWCFPYVLKELFAFYEAFSREENLYLERLSPYRDYVAWLAKLNPSQDEAFWRQMLKGFTSTTLLGPQRASSGPPNVSKQYTKQQITLTTSMTATLQSWAQQHGLTLNTIMQGTWALLLSRYSGSQDVVFGATTSGRSAPLSGIDSMIGVLMNTLPVRVQVAPEEQVLFWLQALQAQQVEARLHEHTPLVQIQGWSDVPRGQPLFESILLFEAASWISILQDQGGDWEKRGFELREQTHYSLTATVTAGSQLSMRISYDDTRFDEDTITRMLGHYRTVLEAIVDNPNRRLADFPLLTAQEWQRQVVEWNKTKGDYAFEQCLHHLIEAQVERTPERIAVDFEGAQLTYRELNRRANRLAHRLQRLGIGPDIIVGLCAERSLEILIGLLGILKAGGAYMPLDPTYPQERLAYMLHDASVSVIVAQLRVAEVLPEGATVVILDDITDIQEKEDNPAVGVTSRHLAYVIYTSGSTGQPKGVLIEHRAICNNLLWMQRDWPLTKDDRVLQKAPFTFDVSVKEFFWPLLAGASLVIARPEGHRDPAYLQRLIIDAGITVTHFVPSMLHAFLAQTTSDTKGNLRLVMCGAEALSVNLLEQFYQKLSADLLHLYGPTEAAIAVTGWLCQRAQVYDRVPLGYSMPNVQLYVLDAYRNPSPVGVVGELYIGGAALARGYLNRPEETDEKFVVDPFCSELGARLYRTGDLVRYQADGKLEFLGRVDHQVKVRGLRIELGEIEEVLKQYPAIHESAVLVREEALDNKYLVAYLVVHEGQEVLVEVLRKFLDQKLPGYMIPANFFLLAQMPLSANGKVDRQVLAQMRGIQLERHHSYDEWSTETEHRLKTIWEEVLGSRSIGINDNFFELGGHSLLVTKLASRIYKNFNIELSLRTLFEKTSIVDQAQVIEQEQVHNADKEMLSKALSELEELSEGQVQSLLKQQELENEGING